MNKVLVMGKQKYTTIICKKEVKACQVAMR